MNKIITIEKGSKAAQVLKKIRDEKASFREALTSGRIVEYAKGRSTPRSASVRREG